MGAGFALYVHADDAQRAVDVARACGVPAWVAGQVAAGPKQLHIEPLGVRFSGEDLQLR
jgi:phosphoribosylformylglycinamidine cyclo-ligase